MPQANRCMKMPMTATPWEIALMLSLSPWLHDGPSHNSCASTLCNDAWQVNTCTPGCNDQKNITQAIQLTMLATTHITGHLQDVYACQYKRKQMQHSQVAQPMQPNHFPSKGRNSSPPRHREAWRGRAPHQPAFGSSTSPTTGTSWAALHGKTLFPSDTLAVIPSPVP